ncbi:formylglycine-generating enzyme family protein [Martelella alba]|uniref:Formylglycine-generating enzyme family protein n=1 Tax=Martelella alba TaxID=2590451 RepID=A0ABY2SSK8_9HYPH|nr:formylglycine-generating enzyme family protein [Martelella alba]TKI07202.1 formylglycine-generating enzyme family protein [Martelella alba]
MRIMSISEPQHQRVFIPAGTFAMGSENFYPEERPIRQVAVAAFHMDKHLVTNAQFARFVEQTGYRTFAELPPDPALYPEADPALLVPGSLVFTRPNGPVSLRDYRAWWAYVPGACWRHPEGPDSNVDARGNHPVVQVTFGDAMAYAAWAGGVLPDEAQWEYAARGGLDGATYPWGDDFTLEGRFMANTWQGRFPWENLAEDGYEGTSPVMSYPPNGYGLFDVVGNVWEWTRSDYTPRHDATAPRSCCAPAAADPTRQRKVVKGGSHLCAPSYCLRYRPAARQGQTLDTATNHIGFRCITQG